MRYLLILVLLCPNVVFAVSSLCVVDRTPQKDGEPFFPLVFGSKSVLDEITLHDVLVRMRKSK